MAEKKDPYEVLGIKRSADEREGQIAYRMLSKKYHPDQNPGDHARVTPLYNEVQEAWKELKDVLPKPLAPLPPLPDNNDPEFYAKMEQIIGQWWIDNDRASLQPPKPDTGFDAHKWSTVGGASEGFSTGTPGIVSYAASQGGKVDWRKLTVGVNRDRSLSLIKINATEAAFLLQTWPNACAALKVVQQRQPALCLYDAILVRAGGAPVAARPTESKALAIIQDIPVDTAACEAALRDPMASIQYATDHAGAIAPQVKFGNVSVNPEKLAMDLWCMKTYVKDELMPRFADGPMPKSAEQGIRKYNS